MRCQEDIGVASLVLGLLDPGEHRRLQEHVSGCASCQRTQAEFSELPGLLDKAAAQDLTMGAPAPSELTYERLQRQLAPGRRRPRTRWYTAAAAALVLTGLGAWAAVDSGDAQPAVVVSAASGQIHALARFIPNPTGTTISLTLSGVMPGQTCQLVAIGRDGHRETASTWIANYQGSATVHGSVAMSQRQMARLEVETLSGRTLITLPAQ
jgi:anti-sigma-K factor RskA